MEIIKAIGQPDTRERILKMGAVPPYRDTREVRRRHFDRPQAFGGRHSQDRHRVGGLIILLDTARG